MRVKSVILGIQSTSLSKEEYLLFKSHNPLGFILFARNCESKQQIKQLISQLKDATGRGDIAILIDQEGGKVQQLKYENAPTFPPASYFANIAINDLEQAKTATYNNAKQIAHSLSELGINHNCAPVADIFYKDAHDIIGNRSFGDNPQQVATLAGAMAQGLIDNNITPIVKHIPGHGRAKADSHQELPIINTALEELNHTDFLAFKLLNHLPIAMTAHVIYQALDPENAVTISKKAIDYIRNEIGFTGKIITDDLGMQALKGSRPDLAKQSLLAGCDILMECHGTINDMHQVADNSEFI